MDELSTLAGNAPIWITRWGTDGSRVVMVHGSAQGSEVGGAKHFAMQQRLAERGWQVLVPTAPAMAARRRRNALMTPPWTRCGSTSCSAKARTWSDIRSAAPSRSPPRLDDRAPSDR